MIKPKKERQMVFTTSLVEESIEKLNDGVQLKRYQNPWLKSEIGIRRSGVSFRMSKEEQQEYIKCAVDIDHFVEKYCKVKREDGSVGPITLRDYQSEILHNFVNSRFNILMASRQVGKTISSAIFMLHKILFDNDKNIMIVANKGDTAIEIVDKIKSIYTLLPFFLKPGVKTWNQKSLSFENGCRIKTSARSKTPAIGFTIDVLYLDEFAHIPSNIIVPYYTAAFPTTAAVENSKIIITSTPNGMNLFHDLLINAERPDGDPLKNNYKAMRVYWYQVPGRFVTYIRLDRHKLSKNKLDKESILEAIELKWGEITKVSMKFNNDLQKDIISIFNNDLCRDEDIMSSFIEIDGRDIAIRDLGEVTTWKLEAMKDIGGEDAFNQEYGLRFINASKSLLNEAVIDRLVKGKCSYEYEELYEFSSRLKFKYDDLKWVIDDELFNPLFRKEYKFVISVDIAEGLGLDYSVINIFKVGEKDFNTIEANKFRYTKVKDFFRLDQVGIFRSNIISIRQLAELLYTLVFEYLNPENCEVVIEFNNYGNTLIAELPSVFDGYNEYGSYVISRFKHRADSDEERMGVRLGDNKKLFVKNYQDLMQSGFYNINNEETINEITTFVKHTTTSGNITYKADVGNDDCVMTIVNSTEIYNKHRFEEMINDWYERFSPKEFVTYVNDILNTKEYIEGVDYKAISAAKSVARSNIKALRDSNMYNKYKR